MKANAKFRIGQLEVTKAKYKVNQVIMLLGYRKNDPRALGIVKSINKDGFGLTLCIEIYGRIVEDTYTIGELRPLTKRERGK